MAGAGFGGDKDSIVFFDDEFKPYSEVSLGLMTHGLLYGTGCFEGIRGYWNEVHEQLYLLQAAPHYDRFHQSARILMMNLGLSTERLVEITVDLLRRNEYRTDCYIRPLLFKSGEGIGMQYEDVPESLGIYTCEFGKWLDTDSGIRCKVVSWRRVPDSAIPVRAKVTGAYINSHMSKVEALRAGYDEAIVLDMDGHAAESTGSNLFMKRAGIWVTPPVNGDILEGITRRMAIDLITDELGLQVVERLIDRTELYACEEVFLCGTGAEICPVLEIDDRAVGTGKIGESTQKLQELFFNAVRGEDKKYSHWLLPVY